MPKKISSLLVAKGLLDAYYTRPPYQQNDYLGWISRANWRIRKKKRTQQMLDELKGGDRYMNMKWNSR